MCIVVRRRKIYSAVYQITIAFHLRRRYTAYRENREKPKEIQKCFIFFLRCFILKLKCQTRVDSKSEFNTSREKTNNDYFSVLNIIPIRCLKVQSAFFLSKQHWSWVSKQMICNTLARARRIFLHSRNVIIAIFFYFVRCYRWWKSIHMQTSHANKVYIFFINTLSHLYNYPLVHVGYQLPAPCIINSRRAIVIQWTRVEKKMRFCMRIILRMTRFYKIL